MRWDYLRTFAAQGLVIVSLLFIFRYIAHSFGAEPFGEYALVRRTLAVLAPIAILGADNATARHVAHASARGRSTRPFLPAALFAMVTSVTLVSAVALAFREQCSILFFGSSRYTVLVVILPCLLMGTGLSSVCYSYLRGNAQFNRANIVLVTNFAVLPLASLAVGGSVARIFVVLGCAWIVSSALFLSRMPMSVNDFWRHVRQILRFGIPRAPGDALQLGLFAAPGIAAAHVADLRMAGVIAFGTSALAMVGSVMTPIEFILLPHAARRLAAGQARTLKTHVGKVLALVALVVTISTCAVEILAGQVVKSYLGPAFSSGTYALQIMMLGAPPYATYCTLKSVVDAKHIAAINTRNMFVASCAFAVGTLVSSLTGRFSVLSVLSAFTGSVYVLACMTAWEAHKALANPVPLGGDPGVGDRGSTSP